MAKKPFQPKEHWLSYKATCPYCGKKQHFSVTFEEWNIDYEFTCENERCDRQSPLSEYTIVGKVKETLE